MGAAGYVTIYDYEKVATKYHELYPDRDLHKDRWYLSKITVELDGKKWILDYWDDQNNHQGAEDDFWFANKEAQERVFRVLQETENDKMVEVWT